MSTEVPTRPDPSTEWHRLTAAFLVGLTLASALFAHVAAVQTPGLDPPPETFALFVVAAVAGAVAYVLVSQESAYGYAAAALAALVVLAEMAAVLLGVFGDPGPETNPLGPIAYAVVALATLVAATLASRRESAPDSTGPSTPMQ